jgi:hypothetical protein
MSIKNRHIMASTRNGSMSLDWWAVIAALVAILLIKFGLLKVSW